METLTLTVSLKPEGMLTLLQTAPYLLHRVVDGVVLLEATSRMSTIRKRHIFRSISHPLRCLLFLDLEAKESWSRVILILFKPRRTALNLKSTSESWTSAFGHTSFIDKLQQIMENFIVLHECKDAKHADLSIRFNMNNGSMEDSEVPSQRRAHSDDGDDETPNYK
jgi:hypothetical protein